MKKLLQEIRDFEKYKDCLSKELYEAYKSYLVECSKKVLNEITVEDLASTFKFLFDNNMSDDPETTINSINKFKKATLKRHYTKKHNHVIKAASTNLEIEDNEFCDKETFIREFKKLNFDEFKNKADLGIKSTPDTFLKSFLEIYDEDGWLILDDYEGVKK